MAPKDSLRPVNTGVDTVKRHCSCDYVNNHESVRESWTTVGGTNVIRVSKRNTGVLPRGSQEGTQTQKPDWEDRKMWGPGQMTSIAWQSWCRLERDLPKASGRNAAFAGTSMSTS